MITITDEQIEAARDKIATGNPEAVGYRLMLHTIDDTTGLDGFDKERFKELANIGFEKQTNEEAERQSKGSHFGLLVSKGEQAYQAKELGGDWVDIGDLLIFDRYAGVTIELPPGSGNKFRFTNDESVLGRIK